MKDKNDWDKIRFEFLRLNEKHLVNTEKWNTFKKCLEEKEMDNTPATAHKEGVERAIANGILTGNEKGDLMLSNPITRQQFCTMLYRYHKNFVK